MALRAWVVHLAGLCTPDAGQFVERSCVDQEAAASVVLQARPSPASQLEAGLPTRLEGMGLEVSVLLEWPVLTPAAVPARWLLQYE